MPGAEGEGEQEAWPAMAACATAAGLSPALQPLLLAAPMLPTTAPPSPPLCEVRSGVLEDQL